MEIGPIIPIAHGPLIPRPKVVFKRIRQSNTGKVNNLQNDIQALSTRIDFKIISLPRTLPGAFRNETWLVNTTAGKFVLKRYKSTLENDQIVYEHSILNYLAQKGFPSPRLIPDKAGNTIIEEGGRYYAIYEFLEGYIKFGDYFFLSNNFHRFLFAEGQILSSLHEVLDGFSPTGSNLNGFQSMDGSRWRDLGWYLDILSNCQNQTGSKPGGDLENDTLQTLNQSASRIEDELSSIDQQIHAAKPGRRIIHGDFRPYNLMVKPGSPMVVLDFELSHLDWRLLDLISLLTSSTRISKDPEHDPRIGFILKGYQSIHPIPAEEYELFPLIWKWHDLRRIIICWQRYLDSGHGSWLGEVRQKIEHQKWIQANQKPLSSLYNHLND